MYNDDKTMTEKTIKTDEVVHEELERLKRKYGVETFNGVLRRELGISPGTDISKLTAYLNEELRTAVKKLITEIEQIGSLERGYEEDGWDYLTFKDPKTDRKIADIRFRDGSFTIRYRDNNGEMKKCGKGYENSNEGARYGTTSDLSDRYDLQDVRGSVLEKVEKAHRRWGKE